MENPLQALGFGCLFSAIFQIVNLKAAKLQSYR
jgi:hypothetical protein